MPEHATRRLVLQIWQSTRRRLSNRADTEHEQAIIRVGFATLIAVYILLLPDDLPDRAWIVGAGLAISFGCLVASLAVVVHILLRPQVMPARRYAGILIDMLGLNGVMLVGGMSTALFYPLLLWVILGHGFRFGTRYLFAAAGLAVFLFGVVITFNPDWRRVPMLDAALLLALVILPAYFARLYRVIREARDRAEEANAAKSRFLAAMSHELRTPLNAIIGMTDLMSSTELDREQRTMTETVRTAAKMLLSQVNDLLDLARLEAGRYVVDAAPFDLFAKLASIRSMLHHQAMEKGLFLRLRLDPVTPRSIVAPSEPIRHILVNLLANALKFTHAGGVLLEVGAKQSQNGRPMLTIDVSDTGIGIAVEHQKAIFERFSQAHDRVHQHYGGSGLGLSICRELCELMGGTINLTSAPGEGSRFHVEIPYTPAEEPDDAPFEIPAGTLIVYGNGEGLKPMSAAFAGTRARVIAAATPDDLRRHLQTAPGRCAVAVLEGGDATNVEGLARTVAQTVNEEPVDILTVGKRDGQNRWLTLADLPPDYSQTTLRKIVAAALAPLGTAASGTGRITTAANRAQILLAEDNRVNQRVIGAVLERAGHEVTIAASGEEAVEILGERSFDLVLMDMMMPGMSGMETMKMLRFTLDQDEMPPIVALSADATPEMQEGCRRLGFSDYLTKPIDADVLLSAVERIVAGRVRTSAISEAKAERTSPVPATRVQALDRSKLERLLQLDPTADFIRELIDDFISDGHEIISRLAAAAAQGDAKRFRDEAHALRSSAAHLGGVGLFQLCLAWRELDDAALIMRAPVELQRLEEAFEALKDEFEDFRASLPSS